jgi:hypothetical protein
MIFLSAPLLLLSVFCLSLTSFLNSKFKKKNVLQGESCNGGAVNREMDATRKVNAAGFL